MLLRASASYFLVLLDAPWRRWMICASAPTPGSMAGGSILEPIVGSLRRICGMEMDLLNQPTPPRIFLSQIGTCPTILSWEHIALHVAAHYSPRL
jgi:hypothetical protein